MPTKGDFDRAVSQPWSLMTCLVAQLMIRKGVAPSPVNMLRNPLHIANANGLRELMAEFDLACDACGTNFINWGRLAQIRKSLPRFNWPWQKLQLPT